MSKKHNYVYLPNTSIKSGKWYTANRDLYSICYGLAFREKQSYYCEVDGILRSENGICIQITDWTTSFHPSTDREIRPGHKKICKKCMLKRGWTFCLLGYCNHY